ncbi:MAG TPA: aspartate aminotransferase family protein [bacterium]|nr:aspartate aminotransferase family protein [bacterium]
MEGKDNKSRFWRERDRKVLWHPFTQHALWQDEDFPVIVSGEGVYLFDADGNKYLDGVSSLWLNVHGHRRPEIDQAIRAQLDKIAHSTFLGLSHPPGIELAEKLIAIAPPGLSRVFFSDDGSTAMEIALKMAYQYWTQQDPPQPQSSYFIKLENAYHGDTIGSVSLGGIDLFHQTYRPLLFPTITAPCPNCRFCHLGRGGAEYDKTYVPHALEVIFGPRPPMMDTAPGCRAGSGCLAEIDRVLAGRCDEIAGVVIEPCVQGAAGMIVQPEGFVKGVHEICDHYGVLMIADEVATGFGRTGTMFACEHDGVTPDIMAVGKGLSGGYLPIAATLTTEDVFESFQGPTHSEKTFFHGHSYTANPLACSAALASLALFEKDRTIKNVEERSRQAGHWLGRISRMSHVAETKQAGLMMGIALEEDPYGKVPYDEAQMTGRRVCQAARKNGLIIRPLGDVIVLMPPLCVDTDELDRMMSITMDAIKEETE